MMRTLWTVLTLVLVLNVLAMAVGAGWLYSSGRLNRERLRRAVEVFSLTIEDERTQTEQARQLAEQSEAKSIEAARLAKVGDGPVSIADRLASDVNDNEVARQRIERLDRERDDLLRQMAAAKEWIAKQQADIESQRKIMEQARDRDRQIREDENFKQAVKMYEQTRPAQAKQMFQQLMSEGRTDQVVEYLVAMQLRKSGNVLKEFKTPDEIVQATDLIQRLRQRGVAIDSPMPAAPIPPAAGRDAGVAPRAGGSS